MAAILQTCMSLILNKPNNPADLNGAVTSAGLIAWSRVDRKMCHTEASVCQNEIPRGTEPDQ